MRVWYTAYGSNLASRRFACYLAGGCMPGGNRTYLGCRDTSPATASRAVHLPGSVFFADRSRVWGGAMAFYDPETRGQAAARAWLITLEQFSDVAAQENRGEAGDHIAEAVSALGVTGGLLDIRGRYRKVLNVGELDGTPMLTFTCPEPGTMVRGKPAQAYEDLLCAGLMETFAWDGAAARAYLGRCTGDSPNV